jgi:hypothetical protein
MEPDSAAPSPDRESAATFDLWRDLSMLVLRIRHSPLPASSNEVLLRQIDQDPDGLRSSAEFSVVSLLAPSSSGALPELHLGRRRRLEA